MRTKNKSTFKLLIPAQRANPSPPIGSTLGQKGINLKEFCASFNSLSKNFEAGTILSTKVLLKSDKSFELIIKGIPTSHQLNQLTNLNGNLKTITSQDILRIAQTKIPDLNTKDINKAILTIKGTMKSMGIVLAE
ncbi:50S ribosomal subunit protein L11 [Candidatus Tremblaya phenacola PAVE]|nr:50S ribosomal subunit protein L11 [Candidatus Tremblaya phenacola PAVE]